MKVIINYFTIFIIIFLFVGCEDNITGVKNVGLNQEFELAINETAHIKDTDLLITFVKVIDDSRCPMVGNMEGDCIWQGNGETELKINAHKQERVDSLNTFLDPKQVVIFGYKVRLEELNPYPQLFQKTNPKDYMIKLSVSVF